MSDDVTKARTLRSQMYHAGSMVLCPPILGSLDFDADLVSMDLQYPKYRLGESRHWETAIVYMRKRTGEDNG